MKINQSELKALIIQEVKKLEKIDKVKSQIKLINETFENPETLEEEQLDEFLRKMLGGIGAVGKSAAQGVKQGVQQAAQGVKQGAQNVKQNYQQGVQKTDQAMKQSKLAKLKSQLDSLQKQYKQLSGKNYKGGAVTSPAIAENKK